MSDIPQIDTDRLDPGERLARLFIGLADHLRLVGRHTDATLLINWAYQLFDAVPAWGVALYNLAKLQHSNDNNKSFSNQSAKRLCGPGFPNTNQSVANRIAVNRVAAFDKTRSHSTQESATAPSPPRLDHIGGTLPRLVLFARTP